MFDNIFGNLTIGIVKVSKHPHPGHTGGHAGWLFPLLHKLDAETTFLDVTLFLNDPDIIGTGSDAIFTANAPIFIDEHHSVLSLMGGSGWTHFDTGRVITMLALDRQELATEIWKSAILPLFEMIVGFFCVEAILIMAGHSTGMTPYTLRLINHHSISCHNSPNFTL